MTRISKPKGGFNAWVVSTNAVGKTLKGMFTKVMCGGSSTTRMETDKRKLREH